MWLPGQQDGSQEPPGWPPAFYFNKPSWSSWCCADLKTTAVGTGFLLWLRWYRICLQCRRPKFDPWVRKIPWGRDWQPTSVFLPGEFHGSVVNSLKQLLPQLRQPEPLLCTSSSSDGAVVLSGGQGGSFRNLLHPCRLTDPLGCNPAEVTGARATEEMTPSPTLWAGNLKAHIVVV